MIELLYLIIYLLLMLTSVAIVSLIIDYIQRKINER
jgi:hypothetical protein